MDKYLLLQTLPPFNNKATLIEDDQSVSDIVTEVLDAHEVFESDYDTIVDFFSGYSVPDTCKMLFDFCKQNIAYEIESDKNQTSRSPAATLALGYGDCKHYAGFIAGVLDALNRDGEKINWLYRFASYNPKDSEPQHVFVVVKYNGREIWIDPVLDSFDSREPAPDFFIDKKTLAMALHRISGIDENDQFVSTIDDRQLPAPLVDAIQTLLYYKVMDLDGNIDDNAIIELQAELPGDELNLINNSLDYIYKTAQVSGIFDDIWHGFKKVTGALPRLAYLSMVRLNAFSYATKLKTIIADPDGLAQVKKVWVDRFAGSWGDLSDAINDGSKRPALLGATVGNPAIAAWAVSAAAIIGALAPIITNILNKLRQQGDPTASGLLQLPTGGTSITSNPVGWIQQNPIVAALVAFAAYEFLLKPKKRTA